jgi:hypothetical protein
MDLEGPVGSPAPAALLVRSDPVVAGLCVTDRTLTASECQLAGTVSEPV